MSRQLKSTQTRLDIYNWLMARNAEDGMICVFYDHKIKLAVMGIISKQVKQLVTLYGPYYLYHHHFRTKMDMTVLQLYKTEYIKDGQPVPGVELKVTKIAENEGI